MNKVIIYVDLRPKEGYNIDKYKIKISKNTRRFM